MSLILVNANDIVVGKPIPWSLYNEEYTLLLSEGVVVRDENHRNGLLAGGAYRQISWDTSSLTESTPDPITTENADAAFTFDDMRLKVEDRLQLETPPSLNQERFTVKVVGYLKGGSIIITAPIAANGLRVMLNEKDKVVMRSFSGINAFAFVSTIERIIKLPYVYIHLSFPDNIQGLKVRNAPRIKTNIITTVQNSTLGAESHNSALISDISADGASLVSKQPLGSKGDTLELAFRVHLHNVDALLTVKSCIRTMVKDDDTADTKKPGFSRYGVEFQDFQPNDYVILQSMIYQQMIENPHKLM
jgi:c-di-GMP-binding flagellar brake protein YcgR